MWGVAVLMFLFVAVVIYGVLWITENIDDL
jgi:hypothetical protein